MVSGRKEAVSLDRLKPALMDQPKIVSTQSTEATLQSLRKMLTTSHSGCHVRWPKHLKQPIIILGGALRQPMFTEQLIIN